MGHDTPVSDQVGDNGTEHSGISVPGPGRLATGKIIKRRPSEVLREEEVDGPGLSCGLVSLRSPLFPTRYLALAGGLTRRIERRRTSVRRPAERVDRNGALDRHDWLSACRSA